METLNMSGKERARLEIFGRVKAGDVSLRKAGDLLGLSYRQTKRCWARFQADGAGGLVHQLRGKASNRQPVMATKAKALELYAAKYSDYGPTLAAECLAADDGLHVLPETLRRWLKAAGLWSAKRLRRKHRRRRARKEHFGELVQMDGSIHDWFEGRRGEAVLMVMVDDATSRVLARFCEKETLAAAWSITREWIETHGVPRALYVDRHSIYRSDRPATAEETLAGVQPPTQFGRSLEQLQSRVIMARSPQAKGRVERLNGTLQDRLVKALRRAGISDIDAANSFLADTFMSPFNTKFMRQPASNEDLHRPLEATQDLDTILAVHEQRVVQNDWTVRWRNRFLQLPREAGEHIQPKSVVTVCEQYNGRLRVFAGETELTWSATRNEPPPATTKRTGEIRSNQGQKPAADHAWRRPFKPPAAAAN